LVTTMAKPRILVIGSKDHNRVNCIDWLQPFPNIEEYDSVIINLQSLSIDTLNQLCKTNKLAKMKDEINTLFKTGREVFCIINELLTVPLTKWTKSSNYDWLSVKLALNPKRGTSIFVVNQRSLKYFEYVRNWKYEFELELGRDVWERLGNVFLYQLVPIATNKSKKIIAGTFMGKQYSTGEPYVKGYIHFLPPPTECDIHQAMEIIIDMIWGKEEKYVPPWRKDVEVPRVKEVQKEIQQKTQKQIQIFTTIQKEISELQIQMFQWDSYRDLLTSTGDDLENIVQKALSDIGIKTKKTEKGFPADLISKKVAIEVTGIKGCVGVSSEKVNQTGRFDLVHRKEEKIVLIANTYMDFPPQEREGKMDFSPKVKDYFRRLGVCCLTSKTLFELWKDVISGKKDSKGIVKKILTKNGELMLSEFE